MPVRHIAGLVFGLAAVNDVAAQQPQPMLEEIIVTATRVETNLQQTPMSIEAFTSAVRAGGSGNSRFRTRDRALEHPDRPAWTVVRS